MAQPTSAPDFIAILVKSKKLIFEFQDSRLKVNVDLKDIEIGLLPLSL
jgi:hypothetical protein